MTPTSLEAAALSLVAGGRAPGRSLFAGLHLRVEAGQRWVVVGPNGAGKSSLLAALAGVFPIAAGTVSIEGRALAAWPLEALATRRAWSPQFWSDPFPSTVAETAALAHRRGSGGSRWLGIGAPSDADAMGGAEVAAVLDRLGLAALAGADVQRLSGGERQRVAIATALLQGAPMLLLDEPASHLDPAHQRLLLAVLREHSAAGGSVVASLHDLDLAWDLATHGVLLDGRGGAWAGPREAVLTPERLSAVFGVCIEAIEVHGTRRFVIVDAAGSQAAGSS